LIQGRNNKGNKDKSIYKLNLSKLSGDLHPRTILAGLSPYPWISKWRRSHKINMIPYKIRIV